MSFNLIYVTCQSKDEAKKIAHVLVEEKITACVNIINDVESIYYWGEKVCNDQEAILITKVPSEFLQNTIDKIKSLHSYENPAIIALDFNYGSEKYLNWLRNFADS